MEFFGDADADGADDGCGAVGASGTHETRIAAAIAVLAAYSVARRIDTGRDSASRRVTSWLRRGKKPSAPGPAANRSRAEPIADIGLGGTSADERASRISVRRYAGVAS